MDFDEIESLVGLAKINNRKAKEELMIKLTPLIKLWKILLIYQSEVPTAFLLEGQLENTHYSEFKDPKYHHFF